MSYIDSVVDTAQRAATAWDKIHKEGVADSWRRLAGRARVALDVAAPDAEEFRQIVEQAEGLVERERPMWLWRLLLRVRVLGVTLFSASAVGQFIRIMLSAVDLVSATLVFATLVNVGVFVLSLFDQGVGVLGVGITAVVNLAAHAYMPTAAPVLVAACIAVTLFVIHGGVGVLGVGITAVVNLAAHAYVPTAAPLLPIVWICIPSTLLVILGRGEDYWKAIDAGEQALKALRKCAAAAAVERAGCLEAERERADTATEKARRLEAQCVAEQQAAAKALRREAQRLAEQQAAAEALRREAEQERDRAAKLQVDVMRLQATLEDVLGKELHSLRSELPAVRELVVAVHSKRAQASERESSLRGAADSCGQLVENLHARQSHGDVAMNAGEWQKLLFGIEASRANLADAAKKVREAALGAAPLGEEALVAIVAKREKRRTEHVGNIEKAMRAILESAGCRSAVELDAKIQEVRATVVRAEAALAQAEQAAVAYPELGKRAPPLPDWAQVTWKEALASCEAYAETCNVDATMSATDKAIEAFEMLGAWEGSLLCRVLPGEWSLSFLLEGARTAAAQGPDSGKPAASLSQVADAIGRVRQACKVESDRLDSLDPVGTFPLRHLLLAGAADVKERKIALDSAMDAAQTYQALASELEQERAVAALLPKRDAVERELAACKDAHADAEYALRDAKNKEDYAKKKKGIIDEALLAAGTAARRRLREVDARFQRAITELMHLSKVLPEVARGAASTTVPLPPELLRLWRGGRDLEFFEERERLPCGHVHEVYRVRDGSGAQHVVKRYELKGDLRACLSEAALLTRLRHPHVAEVTGLFSDLDKYVYMQMPYYSEGDLAQWIQGKSPEQAAIRRACRQVLLALSHLHEFRVVHSDVKPENIFVDQFGNAFLGDFDVSVDMATRCSTVRLRQTQTRAQAHFTPGFEAPELLRTGASSHTDMYSFGVTVAVVCGDGGDVAEFVARLKAEKPEARLTAKQALEHRFFDATRFSVELLAMCAICCDDRRPVDQGLYCGSAHFLCGECLQRYVQSELDIINTSNSRLVQHQERRGRIRCPHCPATSTDAWSLYEDADLGRRLPATTFDAYLQAKDRVTENRIWREQQERLQAEVARLRKQFERDLAGVQAEATASRAAVAASNEAATAEFLRRQYPNAVQCPRCGLGPVIPEGCSNLRTHHGEARGRGRVSNACLGCGFFAADRESWRPWDGQLSARGA